MRTIEKNAENVSASRRPIPSYVSGKIQGDHLEKLAVVYVRQSTPRQVLEHRESTDLQYKLANRAVALGWAQDRVLVIDDDLGQSGATAENRIGFQRLLAEIGMNHVGLVLGMEMSRLGAVQPRLASTLGVVRGIWRAVGRFGWSVRSGPL